MSRPTQARPPSALQAEETTTKGERPPPRPLLGPQPKLRGGWLTGSDAGKKTPAPAETLPEPPLRAHPHSRAHMHWGAKLPGCAKEEGKPAAAAGAALPRPPPPPPLNARVPAAPTAATARAAQAAAAAASSPPDRGPERWEGRRKGAGAPNPTRLLATCSYQEPNPTERESERKEGGPGEEGRGGGAGGFRAGACLSGARPEEEKEKQRGQEAAGAGAGARAEAWHSPRQSRAGRVARHRSTRRAPVHGLPLPALLTEREGRCVVTSTSRELEGKNDAKKPVPYFLTCRKMP